MMRLGSDKQIFGVNEQILGQDQSDQRVPAHPRRDNPRHDHQRLDI